VTSRAGGGKTARVATIEAAVTATATTAPQQRRVGKMEMKMKQAAY